MLPKARFFRCTVIVLLSIAGAATPASAGDVIYDWRRDRWGDPSAEWGGYFRASANIRLGPEQRLPNGVSWRMQTDVGSGLAMPRLTWLPNRKRLLTANRLLEIVQGGDMLVAQDEWSDIEHENALRLHWKSPLLDFEHALRQNIALTYVGSRLMSVRESLIVNSSGAYPDVYLRGLSFDLEKGAIVPVSKCPESAAYGFPRRDGHLPGSFLFQYGELLNLCDRTTYRQFVELLQSIDARTMRHIRASESDRSKRCVEPPDRPVFREEQEYVLYLTFAGLAVQASGPECPFTPTPDNPVIVPYRQLEPLMRPGPWKDELLGLR